MIKTSQMSDDEFLNFLNTHPVSGGDDESGDTGDDGGDDSQASADDSAPESTPTQDAAAPAPQGSALANAVAAPDANAPQPTPAPQGGDDQPPSLQSVMAGQPQQNPLDAIPSNGPNDMPRFQRTVGSTLKGMLMGLVMGGVKGAIAGGVSPTGIQRVATNQASIQNSKVKFASAQAAAMVAQAAMEDKKLQNFDEDHRLAVTQQNVGIMKQLQSMGVSPIATTTMNQGTQANTQSAMSNLEAVTASHGAVPPTMTLHVGDQSVSYDLSTLAPAPGTLDQVNKVRAIQGQPAIDPTSWAQLAKTPIGMQFTNDAYKFFSPLPSEANLTQYKNYLANLQNQPQSADRDANIDKMQSIVDNMQDTLDEQNERAGTLKGQQEGAAAEAAQPGTTAAQVANIKATAGPEAAAAEQKAAATTKGQIEGQMQAMGGATTQGTVDPTTGADEGFLAKLPPQQANLVRSIGEGRVELNSRLMASKDGKMLMQQLTTAYPGFDQSKAQSYFKTRQDFTSGKTAVGINSYNTAIAHLGTMYDHVSGTNSFQLNNPASDVSRQLEVDKQLVSTELAKAVSNGQLTEKEKSDILGSISGYTVGSYKTRIQEATTLLNGKLEAYQQQWNNGRPPGAVSAVRILSPQSEQTLARINGQAPPTIQAGPGQPGGAAGRGKFNPSALPNAQ